MKLLEDFPQQFLLQPEKITAGRVLVVGASGAVGGQVVDGLVALGVSVRAAGRNPAKLLVPKQVEVVQMDLSEPESFGGSLKGIDKVFLYAHAPTAEMFVNAAVSAGVQHVVLLSSLDAASDRWQDDFNAKRHREAELPLENSGMNWTFLRPGAFDNNALHWAKAIQQSRLLPMAYPDAHLASIHESDIAEVGVRALLDESLSGFALPMTGPQSLTQRQMVTIISQAIQSSVNVQELTHEEARSMFSKHMPREIADLILDSFKRNGSDSALVTGCIQRILGKPARPFAQWATENTSRFA